MLIATWNVNSLKARLPRVTEWLNEVQPDVLCMQETKMTDAAFPALTFAEMGYDSAHFGQGQWNGVALLSRVGLERPVYNFATGIEPDHEAVEQDQSGRQRIGHRPLAAMLSLETPPSHLAQAPVAENGVARPAREATEPASAAGGAHG